MPYPSSTGVIAAVLGAENASGDFEVVDICFAGMPPQPSSSTKATNGKAKADDSQLAEEEVEKDDDTFVALVSGLELGTNEQASDHRVGLLAEWLLGEVGGLKVS
jgi:DNA polymerase delta subunit 2